MPSVTCLRLSDASVICRTNYFQLLAAFVPCWSQTAQRRIWLSQYQTSDVAENLGRYLSCTERTVQVNYFELMLTVKWKLDIP